MMKWKLVLSLVLVFLLVAPVASYPVLDGYVNDFADLLTNEEEQDLAARIDAIEQETTVEIAILTVETTGGEDRVLYAAHVGDDNGVGKAETDNGIVVLWAVKEDGGAIATGRGIESTLTDLDVTRIGRNSRHYFDSGDFYDGFSDILNGIEGELGMEVADPVSAGSGDTEGSSGGGWAVGIMILFAIILVLSVIFSGGRSGSSTSYSRTTSSRQREDSDDDAAAAILAAATVASIGSSHHHSSHDDDDDSSFGGSGGFGGFGGGGFGGGGGSF